MGIGEGLTKRFQDFVYRHSYVEEFLDSYVATQIQVLREQRGLTQEALAKRAGLHQSQISKIESVNNSSWRISTLKKIARALDLPLVVRFESFSSVLRDVESFGRQSLQRPSFADDEALSHVHTNVTVASGSDVFVKLSGVASSALAGQVARVAVTAEPSTRGSFSPADVAYVPAA